MAGRRGGLDHDADEDGGVTTITDILEFKTPENLGDDFQTNDGAQTSWNKLADLLADL